MGKWTQSSRIPRRSLSPPDAGSPRAPRGRMNRNRSKRRARRESSIANGAPTFCHRRRSFAMPMTATAHALLLARIQFAANMTFHILFPAISIALAWLLLFFRLRANRTGEARWAQAYTFWVKVFAL